MADVAQPDDYAWKHSATIDSIGVGPCSSSESLPDELAMIAEKYMFSFGDHRSLQKEVIELKKKIKADLSKQMKIKQGYVQMQVKVDFLMK
ncbi:hypothetical protein AB6A40_005933 [Gnathostoma spinigerum]|uniref:Uncharacterized protein n=1 Tax=Gnathostoma spinigerum TaxID=75299 RepID=A0ABD6EM47_9BILA